MVIVLKKGAVYDNHPFTRACGAVVFYELEEALEWLGHYMRHLGEPLRDPPEEMEEE